jgi:glycosyltransferase involved in cell wall biosynthesis
MTTPLVDIIIPVLNEEKALPLSIAKLRRFLLENSPYPYRIIIADNGSIDATPEIAEALSIEHKDVSWTRMEIRGRGRALKQAWLASDADIVCYMDVDLSTDLDAFPILVKSIGEGGFDLATGSRLMKNSIVKKRTLKRELTSRCYNLIIKLMFFTKFSDAQCGFKALSRHTAQLLLPHVQDNGWFFDSELLIIAEKAGLSIKNVPVTWVDDPDTRVHVIKTATDDLKGLWRLRKGGLTEALRKANLLRR